MTDPSSIRNLTVVVRLYTDVPPGARHQDGLTFSFKVTRRLCSAVTSTDGLRRYWIILHHWEILCQAVVRIQFRLWL